MYTCICSSIVLSLYNVMVLAVQEGEQGALVVVGFRGAPQPDALGAGLGGNAQHTIIYYIII